MMKYHIIKPDGSVLSSECGGAGLGNVDERKIVGGDIELVTVLYNDERCHMIVNDCGSGAYGHERLPPNTRATGLYWTATIQGRTRVHFDPLKTPMVHGVAILYEGRLP